MPPVFSARRPMWVELPSQSTLPPAERPAFQIRPLTYGEFTTWLADAARADIRTLVAERLVGWRTVLDESGAAIPFTPDAWRDLLTWGEMQELSTAILYGTSRVAPTDAGKSSTPSA